MSGQTSHRTGKAWKERGTVGTGKAPKPQTPAEQNRDAAAPRDLEAPVVHDIWECSDPGHYGCEDMRRRAFVRAFGARMRLRPKDEAHPANWREW